jgi:hypothetical protein
MQGIAAVEVGQSYDKNKGSERGREKEEGVR